MPLKQGKPITFPPPQFLTLDNWKRGVLSLIDKSKLPKDALEEANNIFLYEIGNPGPRPGVGWFGSPLPNGAAIDGYDYYDLAGATHLVAVGGGVVYRSLNDGQVWNPCTGASPTIGVAMNMNQNGGFLYLTNGVDNIIRYDGSTTLVTYTALTTPAAPTYAKTGLAGTGYSYYYRVSAVSQVGFTNASAPSAVLQTSVPRGPAWSVTTNFATITVPAYQTGQTRADIYLSTNNLDYFYLGSTTNSGDTFTDDGTSIPIPSTIAPTGNTTQGPLVEELTNIGVRQYGVRDRQNPYRIWFTGGGQFSGAFSAAYDGGYLNWQTGGKYRPVKVVDYRTGAGVPLATIWCDSADGQGVILQLTLNTQTVGTVSITVPSANVLPGSRGTPAPRSVVNVLNDYLFYNTQAFYNLGSRAQFLNLLSTDEASANIRPNVRSINPLAEKGIASAYFADATGARVFFSVPYGSSMTNNATIVFDTDRQAWLPYAFTRGFSKFLRYTASDGKRTLLCLGPGDTQLSQIDAKIQGDYGVAFQTSVLTGLYPTVASRFDFQFVEEGHLEFTNPLGEIGMELLGIERAKGFTTVASNPNIVPPASAAVAVGWDSYLWDTKLWDDTSDAILPFSESSIKRYFTLQKEMNAVQWHIITNALDATYVLRTLETWGTETKSGMPRQWRIPVVQ